MRSGASGEGKGGGCVERRIFEQHLSEQMYVAKKRIMLDSNERRLYLERERAEKRINEMGLQYQRKMRALG